MGNFDILKVVAAIALMAAKAGAGSASLVGCYQPKEPCNINEMLQKSKS
ncbi:MAG: cyclic lactone autoinducer peptide [Oscillospiraceae bacterium]|nr:cyclic lactone autoinducer peptide [Oscillospiraceae bacterium]MDD6083760.1 cyclic lactone autoinducer peptide [Oscillospiraceae bacterium]